MVVSEYHVGQSVSHFRPQTPRPMEDSVIETSLVVQISVGASRGTVLVIEALACWLANW